MNVNTHVLKTGCLWLEFGKRLVHHSAKYFPYFVESEPDSTFTNLILDLKLNANLILKPVLIN